MFTTYNAFPTLRNSILSGNGDANYVGVEIYGNGRTDVRYGLVRGPVLVGANLGAAVIGADPLLDASFRPEPGSPAIDAGENAAVPAGVTLDLAGQPRFRDDPATPDTGLGTAPLVDVGAFELQPAPPKNPGLRRR